MQIFFFLHREKKICFAVPIHTYNFKQYIPVKVLVIEFSMAFGSWTRGDVKTSEEANSTSQQQQAAQMI